MNNKDRDTMFKCLALFELWNGELNLMGMVILLCMYVYTKKLRRSENVKGSRALTVPTRQAYETEGDALAAPPAPAALSNLAGPAATPAPTASARFTGSVASSSNTKRNQQNKRKRKIRDIEVLESLVALFNRAIDNNRENVKIIVDAIIGQFRAKLGEELENLGFSTEEVVRIAKIFSKNAHAGNLFWGLTADQKQAYVRSLLDDEI